MKMLMRVTDGCEANVFCKLEYLNPSGSIKDRIAVKMVEAAERDGSLKPGSMIIESSSGNTAIALSFLGAVKKYKVMICLPRLFGGEKLQMMKRYGAKVKLIDVERLLEDSGIHGAYVEVPGRITCKEMEEKNPKHVWWARQFSNRFNIEAHHQTAREIIRQIGSRVDAFAASVGTGGTLMGIAEILKKKWSNVRIIAAEPAESTAMTLSTYYEIPGVTGGIFNLIREKEIVDETIKVKDADAIKMAYRLSREEGLFCGISSGANVLAAINVARKLKKGQKVVTVLPDSGDRYFTNEHYIT